MTQKYSNEITDIKNRISIYENGSYKPASVITMQEFSAGALTQVFGTYFLKWFGSIKLPWTKTTGMQTQKSGNIFEEDTGDILEKRGFKIEPPKQISTPKGSTDIDVPATKNSKTYYIETKKNVQADVDYYVKQGYSEKEAMDIVANEIKMKVDKYNSYNPDAEVYVRLEKAPQYIINKLKSWGVVKQFETFSNKIILQRGNQGYGYRHLNVVKTEKILSNGLTNTRINQIKDAFKLQTDEQVFSLIGEAMKSQPIVQQNGRLAYIIIKDGKELKVIVDNDIVITVSF